MPSVLRPLPSGLRSPSSVLWPLFALAGYWALLIYQLGAQWSAYEQYNYGWAVPFLCAYLLWQRLRLPSSAPRPQLPAPDFRRQTSDFVIRHSGFVAYLLFALLAVLWFVARWLHEANPIWRLTSWTLALTVIGLTLLVLRFAAIPCPLRGLGSIGKRRNEFAADEGPSRAEGAVATESPGGQRTEEVIGISAFQRFSVTDFVFPILFFLVAVPWPTGFEGLMTQSFMQANVNVTTELLAFAGIPALQRGNVIEIATGLVGVDEACSGIRSFQATLMISLFLGELYRLSVFRRVVLCFAGFALAFGFNIGRTFLLVYVASRDGIAAIGKWHDPAGVTILVGCFLGLWLVGLWLAKRQKPDVNGQMPDPSSGVRLPSSLAREVSNSTSPPTSHLSSPISDLRSPCSQLPAPSSQPSTSHRAALRPAADALLRTGEKVSEGRMRCPPQLSTFHRPAFALAVWFIFTELAVEGWYRTHEVQASAAQAWTLRWPTEDPTFKRIELSEPVKAQLAFDAGGQGAWTDPDGGCWQAFYFRWQPSRSLYARVRSQLNKTHRPEHCLTGSGMKQVGDLGVGHYRCGKVRFALNRLLFESDGRLLRVFYAQYEDSANPEFLASYRENTQQRIASAWAGSRNYGLRILELAVAGNLDETQADAAGQRQLERLIQVPPARNP